MDFRGGCCIARYGGGGGGAYDMSKVDHIMLRFRPIAPKPSTGGGSSSPPESTTAKSGRGKRKHSNSSSSGGSVSSNGNSKGCRKKRREEKKDGYGGVSGGGYHEVVTLPLLPESPERKDSSPAARVFGCSITEQKPLVQKTAPVWLSFGSGENPAAEDLTAVITERKQAVSCVTVECITDTWTEVEGEYVLGRTDNEKKMNLERDTCPGFISDGLGRVTWTNGAYKELVTGCQNGSNSCAVMVWLVMRERPMLTYPAFTCRVRLQYTCQNNKDRSRSSMTLPCDVWRLDDGGFAWRLDVSAALCLGR